MAALAVAAIPASALAAGGPITPDNQEAHYTSLFSNASDDCFELEKLTGQQRVEGCEKAIDEVIDRRATAISPSVAERANYDFYESLLHIALASAYLDVDGNPSDRVCAAAERSWTLHSGLLGIPKSSVSPKIYDDYHAIPGSVRNVLTHCRQSYGTPKDAGQLP